MVFQQREKIELVEVCLKWFGRLFDLIIIILMTALVVAIGMKLFALFNSDLWVGGVKVVISEILFVLILVELFTILASYLQSGRIKVQRIVEVGIISVIREIIFVIFEITAIQIFAMSGLLLVFGFLFAVEKYFAIKDE